MTKSDLIETLAEQGKLSKKQAELIVTHVFDAMTEAMKSGDRIEIRGFGSFKVKDYKPYTGRNPKTGDKVVVQAKKLPFFKVGKELKELVNEDEKSTSEPSTDSSPSGGGFGGGGYPGGNPNPY